MGAFDWVALTDSLSLSTVDRGVTYGVARPPGGGDFVYAFNSFDTIKGAVGLAVNGESFIPMDKGGSIRGAMKRLPSGGSTGFSPFFFIGLQGASVNDSCYMLGLADGEPSRLALRKGKLIDGIPNLEVGINDANGVGGILRRGTEDIPLDTWQHVRLDMIVNTNGDVILQVFRNDLARYPLGSETTGWEPVPGLDEFIDDQLGINSGSQPYTSGRVGFGFATADISRRAAFDHIRVDRQV